VADAQSFSTAEDTDYVGTLTGDDGDPMDNAADNQIIIYEIIEVPSLGVLTLVDDTLGSFTYIPFDNFNGYETFSFAVHDSGFGVGSNILYSDTVDVNITVDPVNDPPEIQYVYPIGDSLVYTNIDGFGEFQVNIRVYDHDSDTLQFWWSDSSGENYQILTSGQYPLSDSIFVNTLDTSLYAGIHDIGFNVSDNGERNPYYSELEDPEVLSADTVTQIRIGYPILNHVDNQAFLVSDNEEKTRSLLPLTIRNGLVNSTINSQNHLSIILPENQNILRWDSVENIEITPASRLQNPVLSDDSLQIHFDVIGSWSSQDSVEIQNIQLKGFTEIFDHSWIHLSADGTTNYNMANARSLNSLRVGDTQINLTSHQAYTIGDTLGRVQGSLHVWENSVAVVSKNVGLNIRIPDSLNLKWNDDVELGFVWRNSSGDGEGLFGADTINEDGKILSIAITQDLTVQDTIIINGPLFKEFSAVSDSTALNMSVSCPEPESNYSWERSSLNTIRVGNPKLLSLEPHIFIKDLNPLFSDTLAPIIIAEDTSVSAMLASEGIYLELPDSSELVWDLAGLDAIIYNEERIEEITIEDSQLLYLKLNHDLQPGDSLLIRRLPISNITKRLAPDTLRMSLNSGLSYNRKDIDYIAVGSPSIASIDTQKFLYRDIPQVLAPIHIMEDIGVKTIWDKYGVILSLIDSFAISFDSTVTSCSILIDGLSSDAEVVHVDSNQKIIQITSYALDDFQIGDTLTIEGIVVEGFEYQSGFSEGVIHLSVKGLSNYTAIDLVPKAIGRPNYGFDGIAKALSGGVSSVELPPLWLRDDSTINIISDQHLITLEIPESEPFRWQEIPFIQIEGAYQKVSPVPFYENTKKLTLDINSAFTGESIVISGLRVFIGGSVNGGTILGGLNGSTYFQMIDGFLTVGDVTISTADSTDQLFFKTNPSAESRTLYPIEIEQGSVAMIDSTAGIILRIPSELNAQWDPLGFPVFNPQIPDFGDSIWFSDNYKDIGFDLNHFPENGSITISGLQFTHFGNSSSGNLELILDGSNNSMIIRDPYAKTVVDPAVFMVTSKTFVGGDTDEFTIIPDLIIQEDPNLSVLNDANISVILPDEFDWSNSIQQVTLRTQTDSLMGFELIVDGNTLAIPMAELPEGFALNPGGWMRISNLRLDSLNDIVADKHLQFQITIGSQMISLLDIQDLSVGRPGVKLSSTDIALSSNYFFDLEPVSIYESIVPVFSEERDAVLILPNNIGKILDWEIEESVFADEIKSLSKLGDTLVVQFDSPIGSEDTIHISGLKLSSQVFFETNSHLADISKSIAQEPLNLSYRINENIQLAPIAVSADSVGIYPKLFFQDANVVMIDDYAEIHIPLYPGLLVHSDTLPKGLQLTLESDELVSIPILDVQNFYLQDTIRQRINNSSFILEELSFRLLNEDISQINRVIDISNRIDDINMTPKITSDQSGLIFNPEIDLDYRRVSSTQGINLDFGYDLNSWMLTPDSAAVNSVYLPNLAMINSDFSILDSVSSKVWSNSEPFSVLDTTFLSDTTYIEFGKLLPDLSESIYNVEIIGILPDNTKLFPVRRQFLYDDSDPIFDFDDSSPIFAHGSATGRGGFGHQMVAQQRFEINVGDNPLFNDGLAKSSFDSTENTQPFALSDIVEVHFHLQWGMESYEEFLDTLVSNLIPGVQDDNEWSISSRLDSLVYSIIDSSDSAKLNALNSDQIILRLWTKIKDQAGNADSLKTEITLVLNSDEALSDEIFNYPNPFKPSINQSTQIRYVLTQEANEGHVVIMDAGGEIVFHHVLEQNELDIGVHEVVWNGKNLYNHQLASGVYFAYVKIADSFKRIKILILN